MTGIGVMSGRSSDLLSEDEIETSTGAHNE
jgi:hypothetical protein